MYDGALKKQFINATVKKKYHLLIIFCWSHLTLKDMDILRHI